jgi:hypothetical protein
MLAIAQDPDLAGFWGKYAAGHSLILEDTVRVEAALSNLFMAGENAFRLYELGLLDKNGCNPVVELPRIFHGFGGENPLD